jgi:hypothetical protein
MTEITGLLAQWIERQPSGNSFLGCSTAEGSGFESQVGRVLLYRTKMIEGLLLLPLLHCR